MKKWTALCLAAVLTCMLAGQIAVAAAEGEGAAGFWKLKELEAGEGSMGEDEVASMESFGQVVYLELADDGSATMNSFGQEMNGFWDDGTVTLNDIPIPYSIDQGVMSLDNAGQTMRMSRTSREELDAILGYQEGVLDETVVYSSDEQSILETEAGTMTITGYQVDPAGLHVNIRCTNTSENQLLFGVNYGVINRYEIDPKWAQTLDPGTTKESSIIFPVKELERCGISVADEIMLNVSLTNFSTWEVLAEKVLATAYPTGKTAADITAAGREPAETDAVAVDTADCSFVVLGAGSDPVLGYVVNYYFENRTDRMQSFVCDNSLVNGTEVLLYGAAEAPAGVRGYGQAVISSSELEKKGITEVNEIQFGVKVYDMTEEVPGVMAEGSVVFTP